MPSLESGGGFDRARHRAYLEEELASQRRFLESLDRDRRRAPLLLLLLPLAVPAAIWLGAFAAVLVVLGTIALLIGAYYLVWGHRTEYQAKIRQLERELAALQEK
jgi:hypothetical protein